MNNKKNILSFSLFFVLAFVTIGGALALTWAWNDQDISFSQMETVDLEHYETNINRLVIHEISTTSSGIAMDEEGNSYDYIELYNGTDKDIDLSNYGLSDSEKEIKWVFPTNTIISSKDYLLIWCAGENKEGLYTNFKLSSGGDEIVSLRKGSGKVVDAIKTVALEKGQVMGRDANGKWVIQTHATPNYPNTMEGYESYLASLQVLDPSESPIIINEYLPKNDGNYLINGERFGFIELKNVSNQAVSLKNYCLSNASSNSFQWRIPDITLQPQELLLVYTSNKNIKEGGTLHANFKLHAESGEVVLTNNRGTILQICTYENLSNGLAMAYIDNGYYSTATVSPGFDNDASGLQRYGETLNIQSELILSEAMPNNYKYLAQNGGKYYDWIEITNVSDHDIHLSDYYLSDSANNVQKYQLPDVVLKSGSSKCFIASGNPSLSNNSFYHLNFGLGDYEGVYLSKGTAIIDSLYVGNVPHNYSIGKNSNGAVQYYANPTPNKPNGDGKAAISSIPVVSQESIVVNDVDSFTIYIDAPGTIYYTTDGSVPTVESKVCDKGKITFKKTTVLNVMCKEKGKVKSKTLTYSYIINENHTLPVLSMSLASNKFSDLNAHAWTLGYEVGAGNIELLEDGKSAFSIPMGLQLFGGSARGYAKKCYEVNFRKRYGAGHLEYQLFDNRDSAIYQSFILRTGSQDDEESMIRDILGTSLVDEYTDLDVQAYKSTVLYINGKYWGLYFIREKVDEQFVANHYNVVATEKNTDIVRIDNDVKSGNRKKYNELVSYVNNHDLSNHSNYQKVMDMINVTSAADYWIAESWVTNNDIVNCRMFRHPKIDDGRFHYIFYDLDYAFYNFDNNYFEFATNPSGMTFNGYSTTILRNLMRSKAFRTLFLERLSYNMHNTWNEKVVLKRLDEILNELKPEMKRDRKRWNLSYTHWEQAVVDLRTYIKKRDTYILKQAKSFFGLSTSEYNKYFGDL